LITNLIANTVNRVGYRIRRRAVEIVFMHGRGPFRYLNLRAKKRSAGVLAGWPGGVSPSNRQTLKFG
jgi:hypothetical protein